LKYFASFFLPVYREKRGARRVIGLLVANQNWGGTTSFHCGGCGIATQFDTSEQQYGSLVRLFLDQHGLCGDAVDITAALREPHDPICG
jgi:hypothetical protein